MLASAVMKGAPKLKFVKDEVIMTPKHDKNGTFYQWPALVSTKEQLPRVLLGSL